MKTSSQVDWRNVRLRANPALELILFDRLQPQEQQALEAHGRDPDGYGVLRPRRSQDLNASSHAKFVSRDTALLWLTLQQPGPLPGYAIALLGDSCERTMSEMILDGVLEIESGGTMLSGPAASELIFPGPGTVSPDSTLAVLSRRAIEYGSALEIPDAQSLACRLYNYNRVPASAKWRRLLPDAAAVERYLGLEDGSASRSLQRDWVRLQPEAPSNAWIAWNPARRTVRPGKTTCKLYVSPVSDQMHAAFACAAEVLDRCNAIHWKVGADLHGLLRPDKMVAYFGGMDDLHRAAALIQDRLAGCPAQGVPFTSELTGNGLLSWGVDPPVDRFAAPWLQVESWRVKICNRLAVALLQAKSVGQTSSAAIRFAMERVRLDGIDPDTWAPAFGARLEPPLRETHPWS